MTTEPGEPGSGLAASRPTEPVLAVRDTHAETAARSPEVAASSAALDLASPAFDAYRHLRRQARAKPALPDADLAAIQESVRSWIGRQDFAFSSQDYADFSREAILRKIGGLTEFLAQNFSGSSAVPVGGV